MPYKRFQQSGVIFPVSESYCRYKAPAVYDDLIDICTSLFKVTGISIRFHYEIRKVADNRLLARGYTVHAAVDGAGRLSPIPSDLVIALSSLGCDG